VYKVLRKDHKDIRQYKLDAADWIGAARISGCF